VFDVVGAPPHAYAAATGRHAARPHDAPLMDRRASCQAPPRHNALVSLVLYENAIGDEGAAAIAGLFVARVPL